MLEPAEVDAGTGYRYYAPEQIPVAQLIHRLRELDLPLPEVKALMATADPGRRNALVADHLARLEGQLDRTRSAVQSLRQLLDPEPSSLDVELRVLPARTVAVVSATVEQGEVFAWYDAAAVTLDAAVAPAYRTGPLTGQYANALFTEGRGIARLCYPIVADRALDDGAVEVVELPAVELALVTHRGNHDTIAETYGRLGAWVANHALSIDDSIIEVYLVGPRDTADEDAWRTEIGWPVLRLGE